MPTRLTSVVIDSADPSTLGHWWATALGWLVTYEDENESDVEPPPGEPGIELTFVPVGDARVAKNRIHLDLRSLTAEGHGDLVRRLLAAGAATADIGQGDVPWTVLTDPEGNEFCVLEPRPEYAHTGALAAIVVDALDPAAMAAFWTAATGWAVRPDAELYDLIPPGGTGPWLEFVSTTTPHSVKNRVHLDVAPFVRDDQAVEVDRLIGLGATRTEVGQERAEPGAVTWVVLTDPEHNEFCILSSR